MNKTFRKKTPEMKYVTKEMRFYNKTYDEIIQEAKISKFDAVTFKSQELNKKISKADLEKKIAQMQRDDSLF